MACATPCGSHLCNVHGCSAYEGPKTQPAQSTDAEKQWRKERPVYSGVLRYFPDALLEVANVSFVGNQQHNPGEPLHWAKEKSTDEPDALVRHLLDAGTRDTDGMRHSAKVAWRALAMLQREIEAERDEKEAEAVSRLVNQPGESLKDVLAKEEPQKEEPQWNRAMGAYYYGTERACNNRSDTGYLCTRRCGHSGKHEAKWRPVFGPKSL